MKNEKNINMKSFEKEVEIDRIYCENLDINYFKACINELMAYYTPANYGLEESIEALETLCTHITGLRDSFFIFAHDSISELKKPVLENLEQLKKNKYMGKFDEDKGIEIERIYLQKLDVNYFKTCINDSMTYYTPANCGLEESIEALESLCKHIIGLRDSFFIFAYDDMSELKKPVLEELEKLKKLNLEGDLK